MIAPLKRVLSSPSIYLIAGVLLIGGFVAQWVQSVGGPAGFRERFGPVGPLVTVPIQVSVALTPFPSDMVSIANGVLYGFWLGAGLSWLGWWLAALAEYGLGRRARADFDLKTHLNKVPSWLRRIPVSHPAFLIGSRQIPWLGGHVSTFVPGAMGVGFRRYLWCSAVAIVPSSLVMAAIGVGLLRL